MIKHAGLTILTLILLLSLLPSGEILAQRNSDFITASELYRAGKYEEAYAIFIRLYEEEPDSYPVFERTVSTLIQLKRFDEAIEISENRLQGNFSDVTEAVRLGKLHHIAGSREKAHEIWQTTLEHNTTSLQTYRHIAATMNERREYEPAIRIYQQAREQFNQPDLFAHEIANNWLATGNYESAMQEYLSLLEVNRDFAGQIQRQLMRFDEQYLYDVAILETEDRLEKLRSDRSLAATYREFLIWLYMERKLYRRALATARTLESQSAETHYAVFELGYRLRTQSEFELAESAYLHYTENEEHPMRPSGLEQLSRVYMSWASYLENHNLDYGQKTDSLYRQAHASLELLEKSYPRYDRRSHALLLQAELALDYLKDDTLASRYFELLKQLPSTDNLKIQLDYLEGRLYLFREDFNRARMAFTRANRAARIGNLADKTRYYLSLSDFYSGDYEFSKIQLRALERQNTSFFANNALRLRLWIQEGKNQDAPTAELDAFSRARFYHVTGKPGEALETLAPLLDPSSHHALNGEAVLLASSILRGYDSRAAYSLVSFNAERNHNPVSMERIYWEKARLADHVYFNTSAENLLIIPGKQHLPSYVITHSATGLINSVNEVVEAYEDLLVAFPRGFYADKARERIRELSAMTN